MRLLPQALFVILINAGALSIAAADDSVPAVPPIESDQPDAVAPEATGESPDATSESSQAEGEGDKQCDHAPDGKQCDHKGEHGKHHGPKGDHYEHKGEHGNYHGNKHAKHNPHNRGEGPKHGCSYGRPGHPNSEQGKEGCEPGESLSDAEAETTGIVPTASFFTRYELREGYDKVGRAHPRFRESDLMFYRARFGLTTTPTDIGGGKNVVLKFEAQGSGFWGDKGNTLADGNLGLHQATMRLSGDKYWFDAGRFEMAYGEHLVIGSVGWHQTGRTFDGMRTHLELDKGWVDVFVTQVAEDPTVVKPFAAGDQYFSGVYAGLGPMIGADTELDTYVLNKTVPRTSEATELGSQFTVGSRFKKKMGSSYVRAEAGLQVGIGEFDQLAFHGDAEVGTHLSKTKLAAGGWYASGDDSSTATNEGWDELFPTGHKFLGFADIIGVRSNIMGGILRVSHPMKTLTVGADTHFFLRPETQPGVDSFTAVELDTWAMHKIGKGLGLRLGYSLFVPNESGTHGTSDLAHYLEVQLKYALK